MTRVRRRPVGALAIVITALVCLSLLPIGAEAEQAKGNSAGAQATTSAVVARVVSDSAVVVHPAAKAKPKQSARTIHAIKWAKSKVRYPTRTCLQFVRVALQVKRKFGTAYIAWTHAKYRHRTPIYLIPAGVPVFTRGASRSGHIVLSLGNGWVRSTDWPRDGMVGTVKLTTLLKKWHHKYLGWSEDLNGVRVWRR